jgi:hypothetical protein
MTVRLVGEEARRPMVFIIVDWDDEARDALALALETEPDVMIVEVDKDVRAAANAVTSAGELRLPDNWWTNARCHQYVHLAGWIGIPLTSYDANDIPTASMKGHS